MKMLEVEEVCLMAYEILQDVAASLPRFIAARPTAAQFDDRSCRALQNLADPTSLNGAGVVQWQNISFPS
jgi:hypothetical protein